MILQERTSCIDYGFWILEATIAITMMAMIV